MVVQETEPGDRKLTTTEESDKKHDVKIPNLISLESILFNFFTDVLLSSSDLIPLCD